MPTSPHWFSQQERQIIKYVSLGYTDSAIVSAMKLSAGTVKVYISHINRKLPRLTKRVRDKRINSRVFLYRVCQSLVIKEQQEAANEHVAISA